MMAVFASNASISRKSFFSKPFTVIHFQFLPALELLPTMPLLPLTHITLLFTTDKPRIFVVNPECSISTFGKAFLWENIFMEKQIKKDKRKKKMVFLRSIIGYYFKQDNK